MHFRWPFVLILVIVAGWGAVSALRRHRAETEVLATTECPFAGAPRIVVNLLSSDPDVKPVRAHEEVHASQCVSLGPWRYRWRNLTGAGRLSLEAPAYCAAARVRLEAGLDSFTVADRLHDDVREAMRAYADSVSIEKKMVEACAGIWSRQ